MQAVIFHKTDYQPSFGKKPKLVDMREFTAVAVVDTADVSSVGEILELCFDSTNHIDSDWTENDNVIVFGDKSKRSTSVGDLVITHDGIYRCESVGWELVSIN